MDAPATPLLSVVLIGLNEQEHLGASIDAVFATRPPGFDLDVIYVDSGSTDRSVEIASARASVRILHLEGPRPSAAKARNLGLKHVRGKYVQLVDADSVVQPEWFDAALAVIEGDSRIACVFGQCVEMHPRQSVYMRVCGMNWHIEPGERRYCGGNALWRTAAIAARDLFDEELRFGEEPDLCYRVRQSGGKIVCLESVMVTHDLAMVRFSQYWRRARNSGDGYARIVMRYWRQPEKLWLRETILNFLEPLLWIVVATVGWLEWGIAGSLGLLLGWWALRAAQIALKLRGRPVSAVDGLMYGLHCQFVKMPVAIGQISGFLGGK